jgi:hypothetical protein
VIIKVLLPRGGEYLAKPLTHITCGGTNSFPVQTIAVQQHDLSDVYRSAVWVYCYMELFNYLLLQRAVALLWNGVVEMEVLNGETDQ